MLTVFQSSHILISPAFSNLHIFLSPPSSHHPKPIPICTSSHHSSLLHITPCLLTSSYFPIISYLFPSSHLPITLAFLPSPWPSCHHPMSLPIFTSSHHPMHLPITRCLVFIPVTPCLARVSYHHPSHFFNLSLISNTLPSSFSPQPSAPSFPNTAPLPVFPKKSYIFHLLITPSSRLSFP